MTIIDRLEVSPRLIENDDEEDDAELVEPPAKKPRGRPKNLPDNEDCVVDKTVMINEVNVNQENSFWFFLIG